MSTDIANPAQEYKMSPEMVEIVTTYLETNDIAETARALEIPREKVTYFLNKSEAKRFIDTIFLEQGYLNRSKMLTLLDEIIEEKLEEMQEAEMTSSKDIMDILAFVWKIRQDTVKEVQVQQIPSKQTNVQINNQLLEGGENYMSLMGKLMDVK